MVKIKYFEGETTNWSSRVDEVPKAKMRISAIEEYGLRCLLTLAHGEKAEQLSITEIASREGLSVPYVSKLLAILRRAGLVSAVRGRTGGFTLARDPKEITLYEVLALLGGPLIDPNHCQKRSGQLDDCVHLGDCSIHTVLGGLAGFIQDLLSRTTLNDLIKGDAHAVFRVSDSEISIAHTALRTELKKMNSGDFAHTLETLSKKD